MCVRTLYSDTVTIFFTTAFSLLIQLLLPGYGRNLWPWRLCANDMMTSYQSCVIRNYGPVWGFQKPADLMVVFFPPNTTVCRDFTALWHEKQKKNIPRAAVLLYFESDQRRNQDWFLPNSDSNNHSFQPWRAEKHLTTQQHVKSWGAYVTTGTGVFLLKWPLSTFLFRYGV